MIQNRKIVASFCLVIFMASSLEAKEWRGITPLHSTREEVERIIGPPSTANGDVYQLRDEVVLVAYSQGNCENIGGHMWKVPADTVVSITVNPRKKKGLSELGFNVADFKIERDSEVEDTLYYVNAEKGISIIYRASDQVVVSVIYTGAKEDNKPRCHILACPT